MDSVPAAVRIKEGGRPKVPQLLRRIGAGQTACVGSFSFTLFEGENRQQGRRPIKSTELGVDGAPLLDGSHRQEVLQG